MKSRILVSVIGVPVLVYVVLAAPPLVMTFALLVLASIGGDELQQCVSGKDQRRLVAMSGLCAGLIVLLYYCVPDSVEVFFLLELLVFFSYAIQKGGEVKFQQILAGLGGGVFIGWSFSAFLRLESAGIHRAWLLLPFILSFACDTFAYFAGLTLGRHKLAPKVSLDAQESRGLG